MFGFTVPVRWLVEAVDPKAEAFGIRLVAPQSDDVGKSAIFFTKTALALELIADHDPRWLTRLRHDLRSIWLGEMGPSSFTNRICILSWNNVAHDSVLGLALVIIHEGVHARMHAYGVRDLDAADVERQERAAVRQQIVFAARFPDSEETIRGLETLLERRWWTRSARQQHIERQIRAGTIPQWLAPIIQFIVRVSTLREPNER